MDVIRNADWLMHLGPEGGRRWRQTCCSGNSGPRFETQEESYTGQALADYLRHSRNVTEKQSRPIERSKFRKL